MRIERKRSEETKRKISESKKGKKRTEEEKKKIDNIIVFSDCQIGVVVLLLLGMDRHMMKGVTISMNFSKSLGKSTPKPTSLW